MTQYESVLNQCPHCKGLFMATEVVSYNSFGATFYSDAKGIAPTYDPPSGLRGCPYCDHLGWADTFPCQYRDPSYRHHTTLKDFGVDNLRVIFGRYEPHITDGRYEAEIPIEQNPESITLEEARALLAKSIIKDFGNGMLIVIDHAHYSPTTTITDGAVKIVVPWDRDPKSLTSEECRSLLASAMARNRGDDSTIYGGLPAPHLLDPASETERGKLVPEWKLRRIFRQPETFLDQHGQKQSDCKSPRERKDSAYRRALANGLARNSSEERYLRTKVWWECNDRRRKPDSAPSPISDADAVNMRALRDLLNLKEIAQIIVSAEISRELGEFDACLGTLATLPTNLEPYEKTWSQLVASLARNKIALVAPINEEGQSETAEE